MAGDCSPNVFRSEARLELYPVLDTSRRAGFRTYLLEVCGVRPEAEISEPRREGSPPSCGENCGVGCLLNCGLDCGQDSSVRCGLRCPPRCCHRYYPGDSDRCGLDCLDHYGLNRAPRCLLRSSDRCPLRCPLRCLPRCPVDCGPDCLHDCRPDCSVNCGRSCPYCPALVHSSPRSNPTDLLDPHRLMPVSWTPRSAASFLAEGR